jgi:hypothetical protein
MFLLKKGWMGYIGLSENPVARMVQKSNLQKNGIGPTQSLDIE